MRVNKSIRIGKKKKKKERMIYIPNKVIIRLRICLTVNTHLDIKKKIYLRTIIHLIKIETIYHFM